MAKVASERGEENGGLCLSGLRMGSLRMTGDPMCSRHSLMPLALPITNPSKPMVGGQGTVQQIPEWVSARCAQGETHHMTNWLIPADPQPVWDEEAPPLGLVLISKSQSPQPQNGQLDHLSPS